MKAVVLAGGYATRLWPITKDRPKMFLPIGDSTVIDRIFADLEDDDRITEVFVSTNEYFEEEFREYLADRDFEKPTLSIEDTTGEDEKFGVVGALAQLVEREGVDDDLLIVAGDNLLGFDLGEFTDFFEERGEPCLVGYDVGSLERATAYAPLELDGTEVVDLQEKPDEPESSLVSIACYALPAAELPSLETYLAGDNNPDEPGWFMQWLVANRTVHAFTFDGKWFDIGEPEAYLEAVAWELDGENLVAEDADLRDAELSGNVHVMAGATVENSTVANSLVFPGATIRDAALEGSIVDEQAVVEELPLSGAVVGAHSRLQPDGWSERDG
ncbi:sugar phosphate nucleotidyltransferase [Saliphagus sp. LR7]|uniref:sugar phosphate nucleotidyltransferase n=1 Tax=Saliphagus sp. LR7 TaxID=2282654 RepID=UPI000DF744DC|nr:NDP-sugar synthase [Saliphagus sp. LR7]